MCDIIMCVTTKCADRWRRRKNRGTALGCEWVEGCSDQFLKATVFSPSVIDGTTFKDGFDCFI